MAVLKYYVESPKYENLCSGSWDHLECTEKATWTVGLGFLTAKSCWFTFEFYVTPLAPL